MPHGLHCVPSRVERMGVERGIQLQAGELRHRERRPWRAARKHRLLQTCSRS
jgi:hypothetical protein